MFEEIADNKISVLFVELALLEGEATSICGELEFFLLAQLGFKFVQSFHNDVITLLLKLSQVAYIVSRAFGCYRKIEHLKACKIIVGCIW